MKSCLSRRKWLYLHRVLEKDTHIDNVFSCLCLKHTKRKNVDNHFVYVFRVSANDPSYFERVMCPREREHPLYSCSFLQFCRFRKTRMKSGRYSFMSLILLSVHWRICFKDYTFVAWGIRIGRNPCAKLLKLWHITKQFILNKVVLSTYSLLFTRKCLILQAKQ